MTHATHTSRIMCSAFILVFIFAALYPAAAQSTLRFDYDAFVEAGWFQYGKRNSSKIGHKVLADMDFVLMHGLGVNNYARMTYNLGSYISYSRFTDLYLVFDNCSIEVEYMRPDSSDFYFSIHAGRSDFTDISGLILNQPLDGIKLQFSNPHIQVQAQWGALALQHKNLNNIILSAADQLDIEDKSKLFAPNRQIVDGHVAFTNLLPDSIVAIQAAGQIDVRKKESDRFSNWYAGAYSTLRFFDSLNIRSQFLAEVSYEGGGNGEAGVFFSLATLYELPLIIPAEVELLVDLSDSNFTTMSSQSSYLWYNPGRYSDTYRIGIRTKWEPFATNTAISWRSSSFELANNSFFKDKKYRGNETVLAMSFTPVSDMVLDAKIGVFVAATEKDKRPVTSGFGEVYLTLKF